MYSYFKTYYIPKALVGNIVKVKMTKKKIHEESRQRKIDLQNNKYWRNLNY